ncbi:MAG: hypothetical protein COA91_03125 [Robiginitomaculum sp.]|nr:MAG: hypothetical protein COA91_03125 [Robiginitomaculum sp.]
MTALPEKLPIRAGIGLKPEFYTEALELSGSDIWYEVHPENYMVDGGPRLAWLEAFGDKFSLSFHGVGASLGGLDPFDKTHLSALKNLIERFNPAQVSEHATWSSFDGRYFADLLPLPRIKSAQDHMVARIDEFQSAIERRILIENPTNYMRVASDMDEPEFLVEIAKRAGCGLLLDVNNVYISSVNVGVDALKYIHALPPELIGEIHIAGFDADKKHGAKLLIDTHSAPVSEPVWSLLDVALAHIGPVPVLLERDGNIPAFAELIKEQARAQSALQSLLIGEVAQ